MKKTLYHISTMGFQKKTITHLGHVNRTDKRALQLPLMGILRCLNGDFMGLLPPYFSLSFVSGKLNKTKRTINNIKHGC